MQAAIQKYNDVTVVRLSGYINFELIFSFRKQCLEKLWGEKIVFNLDELQFVGSTGITSFFETLNDFVGKNSVCPKFCRVRSEFIKLFDAWFSEQIEIFDQEEMAIRAFSETYAPVVSPQPLHEAKEETPFGMDQQNWIEEEKAEEVAAAAALEPLEKEII